ncbi:MAG: TIGR02710 family CRISPR-associated protein [Planctomycetota bacterium]|nr:MAG: TIGR02710 family CRISPR-associated protein [Planctomycetota bacterium]
MTNAPEAARQIFLICSVGGSPEPVAAALRHWRPARIRFLCSDQTRASIGAALDTAAAAGGPAISPGCVDETILRDPQDLQQSLRDLRPLDAHVQSWQQRGDEYAVVVDLTGGTKVMSASLALVARRWKCTFAYVGGQERDKNGVGEVVSGREIQFSRFNPWDALGYQAIDDAVAVFNHGGLAAAGTLLEGAVKKAGKLEVKRELSTLKAVVDAYAAWDRFDHTAAMQRFDDTLKNQNDLVAIFSQEANALIERLGRHRARVAALAGQKEPTKAWVEDLLHNARRRAAEFRVDDAVARLYRACEALAQVRLREHHGIGDTKSVSVECLPEELRAGWAGRARKGCVMLGLRDAYALLSALRDDLGRRFEEMKLGDDQSPLFARNQSILAHGFEPVGENVYNQLHAKLCSLVRFDEAESHDWRLPAPR